MKSIQAKLIGSIFMSTAMLLTGNVFAAHGEIKELLAKKSKNTVNLLFVQQAQSADIKQTSTHCYTLRLNNVPDKLLYFSDQPQRMVGHLENERLVSLWKTDKSTPNTVINGKYENAGKTETLNFVMVLFNPRYDKKSNKMYYESCVTDVATEHVPLPLKITDVNLFIDSMSAHSEI